MFVKCICCILLWFKFCCFFWYVEVVIRILECDFEWKYGQCKSVFQWGGKGDVSLLRDGGSLDRGLQFRRILCVYESRNWGNVFKIEVMLKVVSSLLGVKGRGIEKIYFI